MMKMFFPSMEAKSIFAYYVHGEMRMWIKKHSPDLPTQYPPTTHTAGVSKADNSEGCRDTQ